MSSDTTTTAKKPRERQVVMNGAKVQVREWKRKPMVCFGDWDDQDFNPTDRYQGEFKFGALKAARILQAMNEHGIQAVIDTLEYVANS